MNRLADVIRRIADYDYVYDPEHKRNPGGGYVKTDNGWSKFSGGSNGGSTSRREEGLNPHRQKPQSDFANDSPRESDVGGVRQRDIENTSFEISSRVQSAKNLEGAVKYFDRETQNMDDAFNFASKLERKVTELESDLDLAKKVFRDNKNEHRKEELAMQVYEIRRLIDSLGDAKDRIYDQYGLDDGDDDF